DRPNRNSPDDYVMGWDNEKKRETLIAKRAQLVNTIAAAEEKVQRCQSREARFSRQYMACNSIRENEGFESLNLQSAGKAMQKLGEQI
ncbi:hypothetical protein OFN55_35655, partial [Escherichia coli]|nr:hypothetical protein [Escherichia coli]